MSEFYARAQETAGRLLKKYGRAIILRRPNTGAYNPDTDSHGPNTPTDTPITAVFSKYKSNEIDGEIVLQTDVLILVSGVDPKKGDFIIDGAETYRVINPEPVKPGDTTLLYKVQARK